MRAVLSLALLLLIPINCAESTRSRLELFVGRTVDLYLTEDSSIGSLSQLRYRSVVIESIDDTWICVSDSRGEFARLNSPDLDSVYRIRAPQETGERQPEVLSATRFRIPREQLEGLMKGRAVLWQRESPTYDMKEAAERVDGREIAMSSSVRGRAIG